MEPTTPGDVSNASSQVIPGMGVIRHADAGYSQAIAFARKHNVRIPMNPEARDL